MRRSRRPRQLTILACLAALLLSMFAASANASGGSYFQSPFGNSKKVAYPGGPLVLINGYGVHVREPSAWTSTNGEQGLNLFLTPHKPSASCGLTGTLLWSTWAKLYSCPSLVGQSYVMATVSVNTYENTTLAQQQLAARKAWFPNGAGYHKISLQTIKTLNGPGLRWEFTVYTVHEVVIIFHQGSTLMLVIASAPQKIFASKASLLSLIANTFTD